jgi:hypothetical protein
MVFVAGKAIRPLVAMLPTMVLQPGSDCDQWLQLVAGALKVAGGGVPRSAAAAMICPMC